MQMKKYTIGMLLVFVLALAAGHAAAQIFQAPSYAHSIFHGPGSPTQVSGPTHLQDYVVEGKLRLRLEDTIRLTLVNNSDVNVNRTTFDLSQFNLLRARQTFDPTIVAGFAPTRSASPSTNSLVGAATLSTLSQTTTLGYQQSFTSGTTLNVGLATTRSTTNSSFATINPSFSSGLTFSVSQPIWRKAGFFVNRAPLIIARRNIRVAEATFTAQMNDAVRGAINQYWDVVQARESLEVLKKSLELAEASYKRDKRALELGALGPLDIYRSESQVAQRKIGVIQAESQLKQAEDALRQTIGADLDHDYEAMELDLTENADTSATLATVDLKEALSQALKNRPEMDGQRQQLAIDDVNVQVANNNLKPDLSLTASYTSAGVGGTVFGTDANGVPIVISNGGFGDSLSQVGGFNFPTYGMSLQMRLPIRNSGAAADLGSSLVSKRHDLYQMRSTEQSIGLQVKNAVRNLEIAELTITAAQASKDVAGKDLAAQERKYQLGAVDVFFVLDAQDRLSQAEQSLVQSQIAYQKALAELDHSTGALLEKYGIVIAPGHPAELRSSNR